MIQFSKYLSGLIKEDLSRALTSSTDQLRVLFSGPPKYLLEEIFSTMTHEGSMLDVECKNQIIHIPIFMIDPKAKDPQRLESARCTDNYLLTVRNSSSDTYLALHAQGDNINLGLETAAIRIGITHHDHFEFDDWYSEPFIENIIKATIARYITPDHTEYQAYKDIVRSSLGKIWEYDQRNKDKRALWRVIKDLYEADTGDVPKNVFMAIVGLPYSGNEMSVIKESRTTLRIAELFENDGIGVTRLSLISKAKDDLKEHIVEFCNHIQRQCRFASDFANNSMYYYAPVKGVDCSKVEIPPWWYRLCEEVWEALLDNSITEEDPKSKLVVECINPVSPPSITSMGMPVVTQTVVEWQLRFKELDIGGDVIIFRASGRKDFVELVTVSINGNETLTWVDDDVPEHSVFVRYRFQSNLIDKQVDRKCIVLDSYIPGVVFFSLGAFKIRQFKWEKKGKGPGNIKREQYECVIKMKGMGSHKFDLFYAEGFKHGKSISGYETNSEHIGEEPCPIVPSSSNHSVCVLETDEECYYDFCASKSGNDEDKWYRVWLEADDYEPTGVSSEYERLVSEHCNTNASSGLKVEVRPSRLLDYAGWCLSNPNSYLPVIFGDGLRNSWTKPNWEKHAIISGLPIMLDPRPLSAEFSPPENILTLRNSLCEILKKLVEKAGAIECVRFNELMSDTTFSDTLSTYLREYAAWLADDYDTAIWMDVISVHTEEHGSNCLQSVPDAILLTPLHPLKLAWQCNAQQILQESLDDHKQCSVAGVLSPSSFPDCMVLSCRNASGHFDKKGFIALPSTSDYWSILWNIQKISSVNDANESGIFGNDFGLSIEGITSSFNIQQVKRSLDEMKRVAAAKSTLRISISSDTKGSSTCNDGVSEWCSANLGLDNDEWSVAGPMSLFVYDNRHEDMHPEPATLASLTARTGENVRWFTDNDNSQNGNRDLSIIAHLGTMNSEFLCYGIKSQVDSTCISRMSIRKQTSVENKQFLAQSRVGSFVHEELNDGIAGLLSRVMEQVEIQCIEDQIFDSLTFAPNIVTLKNALENSSYCAVSSSTVDASCFFSGTGDSYLWDYELPLYSRGSGNSSGFYLLAKESENMVTAVKGSVQQLGEKFEITEDKAKSLLREISYRGVPTLKKLTSGGAVSFGEIGMLVALRVLQTEFQTEDTCEGILPVMECGGYINLIVPADIFQPRYDSLRSSFGRISGERPDLIAISIKMNGSAPESIQITSIEVKARETEMPTSQRKEALEQAVSFSQFLAMLKERSMKLSLWGVAWRDTLATWIDYGFRVYGQLDKQIANKSWTEAHETVLSAIMSNSIDIQIDKIGRLICIDGSRKGKVVSIDQDVFRETLILTHEESYQLLDGEQEKVIKGIKNIIGNWKIYPNQTYGKEHAPTCDTKEAVSENSNLPPEMDYDSSIPDLTENMSDKKSVSSLEDNKQIAAVEEVSTGIKFVIGNSLDAFGNTNIDYFPSNTELNHMNMGIVGDLGTGKTQLLKSLIMQIIQNPASNRGASPSFLILDYKRDYSDSDFINKTNARVVSPFNIPLNMFNTADCIFKEKQRQWFDRSRFFNDLLSKIFAGIGAVQKENIKNAIRKSFVEVENGDPTIHDVFDAYKDIKDGAIDSPYGIMSDMIDGGYFEQDKEKIIPFSEFFDGVVVVDLSAIGQDDDTKNMLVAIFLNLYYEYMLKIEKKPFSGNNPQLRFINSFVLVDEADNIMKYEFSVLRKLLLQGREFGVGIILASQYLSHFKTQHEDYMEPLLTWFVHRVPNITVNQLEKLGLSNVGQDTLNRISRLGIHECLCKTLGVNGEFIRGRPFYELD